MCIVHCYEWIIQTVIVENHQNGTENNVWKCAEHVGHIAREERTHEWIWKLNGIKWMVHIYSNTAIIVVWKLRAFLWYVHFASKRLRFCSGWGKYCSFICLFWLKLLHVLMCVYLLCIFFFLSRYGFDSLYFMAKKATQKSRFLCLAF